MEYFQNLLPIVYIRRNGEVVVSDRIPEDICNKCIRGIMISPKVELSVNEFYGNYKMALKFAEEKGGRLPKLSDNYLIIEAYEKFLSTVKHLKSLGCKFNEVSVLDKNQVDIWTSTEIESRFNGEFFYGINPTTKEVTKLSKIMHRHIRLIYRH